MIALTALALCLVTVTTLVDLYHSSQILWNATFRELELVARQIYSQSAHSLSRGNANPVDALRSDRELRALLEASVGYAPGLLYAMIADPAGIAVVHSNLKREGQALPPQPDFRGLVSAPTLSRLWKAYQAPQIYELRLPFDVDGQPFATIRLGIALPLVRAQLEDSFRSSLTLGVFALVVALAVALAVSGVTLKPLRKLSEDMERLRRGEFDVGDHAGPKDEFGRLAYQLRLLGQQMQSERARVLVERSHFQSAVDQIEDGMMLLGADGRVLFANRAVEIAVGRPANDVLGTAIDELLAPEHPLRQLARRALEHGGASRNVTVEIPAEGTPIQLLVSAFPVGQEGRACDGAILVLRDLQSVAVSARAFQSLLERSAQLVALGQVTSEVTHDVRNPLHAMMVHVAFLKERLESQPPDVRRSLDILEGEITRADGVVSRFIEAVRPAAISMMPLDLNSMLREVFALLEGQWRAKGVSLGVELDPGLPLVRGDEELLRRAFMNVVLNACQALPQGGRVTITTERDGDDFAQLTVADTGAGVPAEDLDKIFSMYYTTKRGGSGIGLPLVRRVVEMHDGDIRFLSTVGQGTRVIVRLPLSEAT